MNINNLSNSLIEAGYNIGVAQVIETLNKMLNTYETYDSKIEIKEIRKDLEKIFNFDNDECKKRDHIRKYLDELRTNLNK